MIRSIGTYLPPWTSGRDRTVGPDEDAVTMAVAAGRQALDDVDPDDVTSVVLVTRDFPLLEGGNGPALLAGLGLPASVPVREQLGGAPAALEVLADGNDGTLVIGSDLVPAGASAVLVGRGTATAAGMPIDVHGVVNRSLPVATRDASGNTTDYADPRLLRERGMGVSLEQAGVTGKVAVVAGLTGRAAAQLCRDDAPLLPTTGASAVGFGLAALAERGDGGQLLAVEQAATVVAQVGSGVAPVGRDELAPLPTPPTTLTPGADIAISLAAYERAFDVKLRLEAGRCTTCATLSSPPRFRCLGCGSEAPLETVPLPRDVVVHSQTTIHVPVPGKRTPYTLVIVQVGDTDVRLLVHLTAANPGSTRIGDSGTLVFRRVAIRSGVPDYGYAFLPAERTTSDERKVAS